MNIVITGMSSGIGRGIAAHLLSKGHDIWGLARSPRLESWPSPVERCHYSQCDVSNWAALEETSNCILRKWGHVDALVSCAGIQGAVGPTLSLDPQAWSETVRTNLDGTFYTIRAFYPGLKLTKRRAKIICFSGGGATKARANFSAYGVAKTGIVRLVENLAEELSAESLDINAVAPGAINTRLTEEVIKLGPDIVGAAEYTSAQKQLLSGGASIEKLHGLVDFLLGPDSDGISGRLLSAPWDPWQTLSNHTDALKKTDIYQLRRILPEERGLRF